MKDIQEVRDDKTIQDPWKAAFFEELGKSIHETVVEILKTKHENDMFDGVTKALDAHSEETMVGACLWASQTSASAGGNLPGPNSLYVGLIRVKALWALRKLANKAQTSQAVLDDVLPQAFDALKLSSTEQTDFKDALKEFCDKHKKMSTATDTNAQKTASMEADEIYNGKLAAILKNKGSPQAGATLTGAMTFLNLLCLIAVFDLTDFQGSPMRSVADLTLAGANFVAGFCTTLLRMQKCTTVMTTLIENPYVGPALGYFAAIVNLFEGAATAWGEWNKQDTDWWISAAASSRLDPVFSSSSASSNLLLAFSSPGSSSASSRAPSRSSTTCSATRWSSSSRSSSSRSRTRNPPMTTVR